MKKIIVYDSQFGNTEKIALAMDKQAVRVEKVNTVQLEAAELIIVGSPTQGGRPTPSINKFLNELPENKKLAVFDTRMDINKQHWAVKLLMKTIGYAADKMGKNSIARAGFLVMDKEGPLVEGELERAKKWAQGL